MGGVRVGRTICICPTRNLCFGAETGPTPPALRAVTRRQSKGKSVFEDAVSSVCRYLKTFHSGAKASLPALSLFPHGPRPTDTVLRNFKKKYLLGLFHNKA